MRSPNEHAQSCSARCAMRLAPAALAAGQKKKWPYFLSSLILPLPVLHSSAANETLRIPHLSASFYSPSLHLQASFYPQVSLAIAHCICFYALISCLLSVCVYWGACGVITYSSVIRAHIFVCVHASVGTRKGPWQAVLNNLKSTQLLWLILEISNVRMLWMWIIEICCLYFQATI